MIGQIKNIRFTYQSESINIGLSRGNRVGIPGGSAAMRRPKRVPLAAFPEPNWSVSCLPSLPLPISAAAPIGRALWALAGRAKRGLKEFAERVKNRRDSLQLAALDDRMLADIGLTRSDLRDAYAEPPWRDPSDVLARRAAERRVSRLRPQSDCVDAMTVPVATRRRAARAVLPAARPAGALPDVNVFAALGRSSHRPRPERRSPLSLSGCCARRPPAGAFFLLGDRAQRSAKPSQPEHVSG